MHAQSISELSHHDRRSTDWPLHFITMSSQGSDATDFYLESITFWMQTLDSTILTPYYVGTHPPISQKPPWKLNSFPAFSHAIDSPDSVGHDLHLV